METLVEEQMVKTLVFCLSLNCGNLIPSLSLSVSSPALSYLLNVPLSLYPSSTFVRLRHLSSALSSGSCLNQQHPTELHLAPVDLLIEISVQAQRGNVISR